VARDEEREAVLGTEGAGGAGGAGAAGECGQLAVTDDLAPRHRAQRPREGGLERRAPVLVERDVLEGDALARKVAVETTEQIRHEAVGLLERRRR
jgi:hypothetical protein